MVMLDFEFKIPLKREDLRSTDSVNQYVVSVLYEINDLKIKIEECKLCASEIGCDFILEYFPTLFSTLYRFNDLDFKILRSFYDDVIVKQSKLLYNNLSSILVEEEIDSELRLKMLNITKMLLYIIIELMKSFQEKIDKTYSLVLNEKRKKNTKMMKLKEDHNWDWEVNEREILTNINNIIKLPLQQLWDPPMVEEDFVRMIADSCYFVLEKPAVTSASMKPTRDIINEILGILIKQYNNGISCKVKIVQLLKLYDHLDSTLAQTVVLIVEKFNCRSLIKELIVEIIETESEIDTYTPDSSSSKSFSNFIIEVAKQQPALILPCINLLVQSLGYDPYSMRICTLTVMAEIIISVLHPEGEQLTEENKKIRDNFMDHLLDHIIDLNTFVRSRALKLWLSIYKQKAVPTSYIIPLLEEAMSRLQDKSSNVVKNAIQLITAMLEDNLYGALLDVESVKQNLRAVKLKSIQTELEKNQPSAFKIWFYTRSDISDYIAEQITATDDKADESRKSIDSCSESENEEDSEESSPQDSVNNFSKKLSELRKFILKQDKQNIFTLLKEFESENINKLSLLKSHADKVQYYEWILGSLCRTGVDPQQEIIPIFARCKKSRDVKEVLCEPVKVEDLEDTEFSNDKAILTYCEDFLRFVETMSKATKILGELMMTRSSAEVFEAIEFFKVAHQFELAGADEGVRNMLLLINSKEVGFKDAVKNTFKALYLDYEDESKHNAALKAVEKLTSLLKKVTHEQKYALENLIKEWVTNDYIGREFILILWDKYARKSPNISVEDSTAAAVLISMYASAKPEIIKTNMEMLINYGLDIANKNNYSFLKQTCIMFHALFGLKNEKGVLIKHAQDSDLFQKLTFIIQEEFTNLDNGQYPEIAMEAITIIYRLSEFPDTTCGNILKWLHKKISTEKVDDSSEIVCKEEVLARFLLIIGHVAFCQWQYLENDVLNELKQRRMAENKPKEKKPEKKSKSKSSSNSTLQKSVNENVTTSDQFEDDSQALANEQIAESVRIVCEEELLFKNTVLAKLSSIVLYVCKHPKKYNNTRLKSAASLALSKLMMISSEFCSENIQLFVTLLERSEEPDVKINLIVAFGDLMFRFPNTIDVWTSYFYNRLKDESAKVRHTTLIIISHLITNEMIKVRGQMSDVALCLVDSDRAVKNLAIKLFYEISVKGNTLYNVMADIISRLSHPDHRPNEQTFQIILKVLMKLITKDRHIDSIVEKLCQRLRGAVDERQCEDLSYCLTLVTYSERSFQKLLDNIVCYADKLNYAKVHRNFITIIINCKKVKASKIIDAVLELENKISIILTKGIDNLEADFLKPPKTPGKVTKTPTQTPKNAKTPQTVASARKSRVRKVRKAIDFDSDDGE
ncbi:condensin complex subunit 1 [Planococcus citri]|uniref:condensin complex subunit 1 n=1 Tax=Planococcus citri TaxID=170843 RepID=UPI0031F9D3FF